MVESVRSRLSSSRLCTTFLLLVWREHSSDFSDSGTEPRVTETRTFIQENNINLVLLCWPFSFFRLLFSFPVCVSVYFSVFLFFLFLFERVKRSPLVHFKEPKTSWRHLGVNDHISSSLPICDHAHQSFPSLHVSFPFFSFFSFIFLSFFLVFLYSMFWLFLHFDLRVDVNVFLRSPLNLSFIHVIINFWFSSGSWSVFGNAIFY